MNKISVDEKFSLFDEHWRPKTIAVLNGQVVKLVKVQGEFLWHHHEHEDEFFMVWRGRFRVEFRDHVVALAPGECVVVPRGVEHRTCADGGDFVLRAGRHDQYRQCDGLVLHRATGGHLTGFSGYSS